MSLAADAQGLLVRCHSCGTSNRMRYEGFGRTFRCGKCKTELPPPAEPIDVATESVFDALTRTSSLPVLVDFWAPWCGPCRMVAPEFTKVAAEAAGQFLVVKVNTEEARALAAKFRISSIPTMAVLIGGNEVARQMGAMPAARIRQFVEGAIAPQR